MRKKILLMLLLVFNIVTVVALISGTASSSWGSFSLVVNTVYVLFESRLFEDGKRRKK